MEFAIPRARYMTFYVGLSESLEKAHQRFFEEAWCPPTNGGNGI